MSAKTSRAEIDIRTWPPGADHATGFVGVVTMEWPADADVPPGAKRKHDAPGEIEMETGVKSRKKSSKVSDRIGSAEDAAACLLLALRAREACTLKSTAMCAVQLFAQWRACLVT